MRILMLERLAKGVGVTGFNDIAAADVLDLADGIETSLTLRKAVRAIAARMAGTFAGAGTGTETMTGVGVVTNRLTATVDGSGNYTMATNL